MIPCYIDMFYPQVGVATLELIILWPRTRAAK